uniref:Adenosine kinase n=1 Tax=Anopheles farauti TaxID=69004 RepID=A0A182Q6M0_9DIPT
MNTDIFGNMNNESDDLSITNCDRCPRMVAFGNVLLDISVELKDGKILQDFDLKPDDQREIPADKLAALVSVAVETIQTLPDQITGTCMCLISGDKRSLNANIGASLHFKKEFVSSRWCQSKIGVCKSAAHTNIDEDIRIFYIEGYFVPERFHICTYIYEQYCKGTANLLVTNLNASYILQDFTVEMRFLVEHADLVFGNLAEFVALAQIYKCDDVDALARLLIKPYRKHNRSKILIATDGSRSVRLYYGAGSKFIAESYPVPIIPANAVLDTTGAGDSFVAGFLYKFMNDESPTLVDCIRYGCKVAGKVIRQVGCNLPSSVPSSPSINSSVKEGIIP